MNGERGWSFEGEVGIHLTQHTHQLACLTFLHTYLAKIRREGTRERSGELKATYLIVRKKSGWDLTDPGGMW